MSVIKTLILSAYYLIYLTMEHWFQPLCVLGFGTAAAIGFWRAGLGKKSRMNCKILLLGLVFILYSGIAVWEYSGSIAEPGMLGTALQWFYYIGMMVLCYVGGNKWYLKLTEQRKTSLTDTDGFWKKIKSGLLFVYLGSMIPILLISPYVFSKADDYSFGYHAHIAWENTGSVFEVIRAAFVMIAEAWTDWQGTFSSIFFMAIQPGVFSEKLYAMVPTLFLIMLTVASYFLMKTILKDWLEADPTLSQICIWGYLLFVVQRVPDSQTAFFWYNGATHYVMSHCALLCAIACVVKWILQKKKISYVWAAFFAVYVGGGNYVTAVGSLLICLTVFFAIGVTKNWKKYKGVLGICVLYLISLALNFMAPGNFVRKGRFEGYGLIEAFVRAFAESARHMFGEWMHWTVVVFVLFMIPVLWHLVAKVKFEFRYPALIIGYSWCYMASLFFAPLFTLGEVNVGRFQNVMFLEWILLLLVDLAYILGWLQRKMKVVAVRDDWKKSTQRYLAGVTLVAMLCLALSVIAEPQKYTSVYAWNTWKDPGLETYAKEYWNMVEVLDGEGKVVEIQDFSYIPPLLDVELRHEGLRLFYEKEVIVKEATQE